MPPSDRSGVIDDSGGEDDGSMGPVVESKPILVVDDGVAAQRIDEAAEGPSRPGGGVSAHTAGAQAVEDAMTLLAL